jgi:hypothetical protein
MTLVQVLDFLANQYSCVEETYRDTVDTLANNCGYKVLWRNTSWRDSTRNEVLVGNQYYDI